MDKIVILANSSGGLAMFRGELIRELGKKYEVVAACPAGNRMDELEKLGCRLLPLEVDRRGMSPKRDLALFRSCYRILKREKPAFVITYTIKPNIYGGTAARLLRIPYAANVTGLGSAFERGGLMKSVITLMCRFGMKKARTVFFENETNRDIAVKERIVSKEKTAVLSGAGVNLERFSVLPYPGDAAPFRFLFMGRVMKEKGVEELFRAMRRLRDEGCDCILDLLGNCEENYTDVLKECEGEGWLSNHGFQSDVRPFIRSAHCFVLPSWHEGMANTNLECAASGRPIITSYIPGCREAVIDGVSGLLCEPRNADSLYAAMKEMLSLSPAQREAMGLAGRGHMESVFDKKAVVEMTIRSLGV